MAFWSCARHHLLQCTYRFMQAPHSDGEVCKVPFRGSWASQWNACGSTNKQINNNLYCALDTKSVNTLKEKLIMWKKESTARNTCSNRLLQSNFSLKICPVLISASTTANHDVMIQQRIGTRWEKMDCGLFCSKQTFRQPRNRVTDWSILLLLTDHWLVCGRDASDKNSHASQLTTNNYTPIGNHL